MKNDRDSYGPVPNAISLRDCHKQLTIILNRKPLPQSDKHLEWDASWILKLEPGSPARDRKIHEEAAAMAAENWIRSAVQCGKLPVLVMGLHGPETIDRFKLGPLAFGSIRSGRHITINFPPPAHGDRELWIDAAAWASFMEGVVPLDSNEVSAPAQGSEHRPDPDGVVNWCKAWIASRRAKGLPVGENFAWPEFRSIPQHAGMSREDWFRPSFREAKTHKT